MRAFERLNPRSNLKLQRSMQVMQPAHLDGSAVIERPFLLTVGLIIDVIHNEKSGRPNSEYIASRPASKSP